MPIVLELTEHEVAALLLLLKLGMDLYRCAPEEQAVLEALAHVPNPVLDSLIAKVSRAGTRASQGAS